MRITHKDGWRHYREDALMVRRTKILFAWAKEASKSSLIDRGIVLLKKHSDGDRREIEEERVRDW